MATVKKPRAIKTYENGFTRFVTLVQGKGLNNFEKIFPLLPPEYNWLCVNNTGEGDVMAFIEEPKESKLHCYFEGKNEERGMLVGTGFDESYWQSSLTHKSNAKDSLAAKTKIISQSVADKPKKAMVSADIAEIVIDVRAAVSDLFFMIGSHTQDDEELDWSAAQFVELMQTLGHGGLDVETVIANYKARA